MELREPPRPTLQARPDRLVRALLLTVLVLVAALGALLLWRRAPDAAGDAEHLRRVAGKLQAAGVLDEAATLYGDYLAVAVAPAANRARIAYGLGASYLEAGRYESALRWLYEAETLAAEAPAGDPDVPAAADVSAKIVHALERLGRVHAAQAALDAAARLDAGSAGSGGEDATRSPDDDPVVARIGPREVRRSEVARALDELPPDMARAFTEPAARREFLHKYVADELLWRKAAKLEYDRDPEVRRRHDALLKQLAVGRFVEREVLAKIEVDPADLATWFEANKERYARPTAQGETPGPPALADIRPLVERDYRLFKMQAAYQGLIESELSAAEVELFPEKWSDGG